MTNIKRKEYLALQKRQQEEFNSFPIYYAFNNDQLEEALEKLGVKMEDCMSYFGHGDIIARANEKKLRELLKRHYHEMQEAMKDPEFAYEAFLYEMGNHEYFCNWSGDEDVLNALCMTNPKLTEFGLNDVYRKARNAHLQEAHEWEMR